MRQVHEKTAAQERAKIRLDQAREKRILTRLQNDLAREIGSAYPSCAVFTYNDKGKVYDHKATKNYVNNGNQTMETHQTDQSNQKFYSIGNQTFQEKSVAVQVD